MNKDTIEILVTGDLCPHLRIEQLCRNNQADQIYDTDLQTILQNKDIAITNLECPLTDQNNPITKSGPALRSDKRAIAALKGYFDVATLANNHVMDQGAAGLSDTVSVCAEAGIATVGVGNTLQEATQPLFLEAKGSTVGIVNVAEHEFCIAGDDTPGANPLHPVNNYYQIKEAKEKADYVIVIVHGGNEHYPLPNPSMVEMYRYFADLGVTAVIGHHSHFASGYEIYHGVPIFYSLGNFLFDKVQGKTDYWCQGYMVKLSIRKNDSVGITLYPYTQCMNEPQVQLMQDEQKKQYLEKIAKYSSIIQDKVQLQSYWENFLREKKIMYYSQLFGLNRLERLLWKKNLFKNQIIKRKRIPVVTNILRCQAHRQATADILEQDYHLI